MQAINGKKIAILATDGFEQSELEVPLKQLSAAGAEVHVVSPKPGEIRGWDEDNWGKSVKVDRSLDDATSRDYDALVLPGGQINPDVLRADEKAVSFVKAFWADKKVIGAICHGPWLLIEAGIAGGRRVTSYKSIRTDLQNAGAEWCDAEVVTDQGLVTSRNPGDLQAFVDKIAEEVNEGLHESRA